MWAREGEGAGRHAAVGVDAHRYLSLNLLVVLLYEEIRLDLRPPSLELLLVDVLQKVDSKAEVKSSELEPVWLLCSVLASTHDHHKRKGRNNFLSERAH